MEKLFLGPLPPSPTILLRRLIRQLYSNDEIVQGIKHDSHLESIKSNSLVFYLLYILLPF